VYLATEAFCETRECDDTSIPSGYIVMLTLSAYIFEAVWVAHCEDMTSLAAARCEDLLSVYSRSASEESVNTETFSFLELSDHIIEVLKIQRDSIKKGYIVKSFFTLDQQV
jgi:hypothetical protein